MERASNLRMIALTSVIALAVVLPLAAATAGPAGPAGRSEGSGKPRSAPRAAEDPASGSRGPGGSQRQEAAVKGLLPVLGPASGGRPAAGAPAARQAALCGPQLTSPEGVEAQTCTIAAAGDTWARTYYRNATGGPLGGVLILMRPDGRTVRVDCPIGAEDAPGACETPRERTVKAAVSASGAAQVYSAVAEFAPVGSDRMLLRAGSNR
ncbi:hypothetical protein QMK19_01675 [Streptomyces sp. H10-C2]|uniref:hypothetical protein n=1 Tax=unclassified Streptomyces TaxID=2593676 RepID=UPI0024B95437|nr:MULTISPECIES: hypothetical protein [unclassified Streptomyces]MDJ0342085.1 hypothetical protein [Streptomyces sp. PH10-H1]MDJ0368427.1 hypothetical protein [Streptomyces sp. H10-C2]